MPPTRVREDWDPPHPPTTPTPGVSGEGEGEVASAHHSTATEAPRAADQAVQDDDIAVMA